MNDTSRIERRRWIATTAMLAAAWAAQGCAMTRGQSSVGEYVDDVAITTAVKARFVDSKQVAALGIADSAAVQDRAHRAGA